MQNSICLKFHSIVKHFLLQASTASFRTFKEIMLKTKLFRFNS